MARLAPKAEKEGGLDGMGITDSKIDGRVPPNIGFNHTVKIKSCSTTCTFKFTPYFGAF